MGALRDFVAEVLEIEGSAIEPVEPDGLEVLAPEPLRAAMGWPELVRLGFGAELPAGATAVGFEGDWLDRFGALLGDRGRWAERQFVLPGPMPRIHDPARLLDHAIDFPNAVFRLQEVQATWTRCLLLAFRTTAVSDEKREGLLWLGFNQGTGAVIDDFAPRLRELLEADDEWQVPDAEARLAAGPAWGISTLERRVTPLLRQQVRREVEPFLRTMRRRLDRDRNRIHQYHSDLHLLAHKKLAAMAKRRKLPFYPISAVTGEGVEALKYAIAEMVSTHRPIELEPAPAAPAKVKPNYPPPPNSARGRA